MNMENEVGELFQNLHRMYNKQNHPTASEESLEHHIDIKASDILFISLPEAGEFHRQHHQAKQNCRLW